MERRNFLKMLGIGATATTFPALSFGQSAESDQYFIYVNAQGGWDVTYFCDPKVNVDGQPVITNWSKDSAVGKAGNLYYAPVGGNKSFFDKHHDKTLVINGVNMNTVNHTSGVIYSVSGKISRTHPTLGALNASNANAELAIPFMTSSEYKNTKDLVSGFNLSGNSDDLIAKAAYPYNHKGGTTSSIYLGNEEQLLESAHKLSTERLVNNTSLLAGDNARLKRFKSTSEQNQYLYKLAEYHQTLKETVPDGVDQTFTFMMAGLCSGYTSSADIACYGFDTHFNNDAGQIDSLDRLTRHVDYIWQVAEAGGIADRLTVLVGSDFSRTPAYNGSAGKDHWPINSYLVMNKTWGLGNQVIGTTTDGHYANKMDMNTLKEDAEGEHLTPEHVHQLVREKLGLAQTEQGIKYALGVANPISI
ncbi:DUF1501 domain-containing protein [Vibrio sp. E150_011]